LLMRFPGSWAANLSFISDSVSIFNLQYVPAHV
jgi:hypothetical protein